MERSATLSTCYDGRLSRLSMMQLGRMILIEQPSLGSRGPLRTVPNAVKVGYRPAARGLCEIEVNEGPVSQ